jgi:hypothetical protein
VKSKKIEMSEAKSSLRGHTLREVEHERRHKLHKARRRRRRPSQPPNTFVVDNTQLLPPQPMTLTGLTMSSRFGISDVPRYVQIARRATLVLSPITCLMHIGAGAALVVLSMTEIKKDVKGSALYGVGYADFTMEFLSACVSVPLFISAFMELDVMFLICIILALTLQALLILVHSLLVAAEVLSGLNGTRSRFDRPWMPWFVMVVVVAKMIIYCLLYGCLGYASFLYWAHMDKVRKEAGARKNRKGTVKTRPVIGLSPARGSAVIPVYNAKPMSMGRRRRRHRRYRNKRI